MIHIFNTKILKILKDEKAALWKKNFISTAVHTSENFREWENLLVFPFEIMKR